MRGVAFQARGRVIQWIARHPVPQVQVKRLILEWRELHPRAVGAQEESLALVQIHRLHVTALAGSFVGRALRAEQHACAGAARLGHEIHEGLAV
jgi:hypothetical protein